MANTAEDWVYVPDESTAFNINTILGTMASSIEDTAGPHIFEAEATATPTDTVNFSPYSAGEVIRLNRVGKVVHFRGRWKCNTAGYISSGTGRAFATLPAGFRPKYGDVFFVSVGAGQSTWVLAVRSNGQLSAERAQGVQGAGYLMVFNGSYIAED